MTRFIEGVRAIAPTATGRPVIEWGVGEVVVGAFQQALAFALASIACILLVMFQSVRYAALVVVPLALAVAFTLALGGAAGHALEHGQRVGDAVGVRARRR